MGCGLATDSILVYSTKAISGRDKIVKESEIKEDRSRNREYKEASE